MAENIIGWEGQCFIPGEGKREPDGRLIIMTTYAGGAQPTPEDAWEDACHLGAEHCTEWIGIKPVTDDAPTSRKRKLITFAVYTTETRE